MTNNRDNADLPALNRETIKILSAAVGPAGCIRLVGIFVEETRERIERIRALALADAIDDFVTLEREAHSLKGAAGTYGAELLAEVARKLEMACNEEKGEEAGEIAEDLIGQAEKALAELVEFATSNIKT